MQSPQNTDRMAIMNTVDTNDSINYDYDHSTTQEGGTF